MHVYTEIYINIYFQAIICECIFPFFNIFPPKTRNIIPGLRILSYIILTNSYNC